MADLTQDETIEVVLVDGAGTNELAINTDGSINNSPVGTLKATYSACGTAYVAAATPTDIFTITGSATKTVRILRVEFTVTTTTAGGVALSVFAIKRSAANTGGTFVADTKVPHDSNNAAATVTVGHYTANPASLGAAVGTVRADRYAAQAAGTPAVPLVWEPGALLGQTLVLRGVSEILAINLNGTTINGNIINISVSWTEE